MTIQLSKNTSKKANHSFFSKWNENSAYLLGLLEADGYIADDKRIAYSAAEKDQQLVVDTHKLLDTDVKITCSDWKGFKKYRWTVTSPQMVEDIKKVNFRQGAIPKIPKKYLHHWLRGLFDGDGSIFPDKQTKSYKTNIVFSNKELAIQVKEYLNNKGIVVKSVYKKTSSDRCWYFNLTAKQSHKLGKLMYKNANIYLKRKKDRFEELNKCRIKGAQGSENLGKLG